MRAGRNLELVPSNLCVYPTDKGLETPHSVSCSRRLELENTLGTVECNPERERGLVFCVSSAGARLVSKF